MANLSSDSVREPLVTVVIPAYNCERYVGRAIRSALAQSFQDFECIVVDDGSTDRTASVIRSFGSRVRVISQRNGGASSARNAGIFAARGRYIAFLDSDDYWLRTKLQIQIDVLTSDPDLVLVSSGLSWIRSSVDPEYLDPASPGFEPHELACFDGLDDLLQDPYLGTSTVVVKADVAKAIGGFDASLPVGEDIDFYFRACADRRYATVRTALARCQLRAGSLTTSPDGYAFNLQVLDRLESDWPAFAASRRRVLRKRRLAIYEEWAESLIFRGEGRAARLILRRSRQEGALRHGPALYLKSFFAPAIRTVRRLARARG
jgi:glycosyltransferase involved in cell wall biosynthesis